MNPLRVIGKVASLGMGVLESLDALSPSRIDGPPITDDWFPDRGDGLRVIDCGLGDDERDGEWVDRDGDRWRFSDETGYWQNKLNRADIATGWYDVPVLPNGRLSNEYAPYVEVPKSSPVEAYPPSPTGDSPAGPVVSAHRPAGHPQLTRDDFMDAARAVREKGDDVEHPNFAAHWRDLAERLEIAAISAAPTRITK